MKLFHPLTAFVFFAAMVTPLMLVNNPAFTVVSLAGAVLILLTVRNRGRGLLQELCGYFAIFVVMSALNPLFVHRGSTPLFFLNGKAFTLEALLYGINSSLILVTAVIWCRGFSIVMTSDRLFCLMGKLSPKISAMLTMAVRFIPDMLAQGRKISAYSRTSGQFSDASLFSRLKRSIQVFSALVTWSIESGVQTADSMKARGFELGGRTAYTRFRFSSEDGVLSLLSAISCAAAAVMSKRMNIEFYPTVAYSTETWALMVGGALLAAAYLYPAVFGYCINRRRNNRKQKVNLQ